MLINKVTMAVPFSIQKSKLKLPVGRFPHKVVAWKDRIILWVDGGNNSTLYYHLKGKWVRQETSGDVPNGYFWNYVIAEVLDDNMFVLGDNQTENTCIYCLDLNTWVWTSLTPNGAPPKQWLIGI